MYDKQMNSEVTNWKQQQKERENKALVGGVRAARCEDINTGDYTRAAVIS